MNVAVHLMFSLKILNITEKEEFLCLLQRQIFVRRNQKACIQSLKTCKQVIAFLFFTIT